MCVKSNRNQSLPCNNEALGLREVWGHKFEELYERYEREPSSPRSMKVITLLCARSVIQRFPVVE